MKYTQRDIVEVNFLFPDGAFKPHPAVIVSNEELQETEGFVYLALISTKDYNAQYCYELNDNMLSFPMKKQSFVKCHLIVANMDTDIIRKISKIKEPFFNEIVDKIVESIF